jgi:hypothetical protein
MNIASKIALAALALVAATVTTASAQDYQDWSSLSPYGLEMVDEFGNVHYVDPYAYDSQVDIYGNVTSSYGYEMDPSLGMSDLTPAWQDNTTWGTSDSSSYYDTNPYAGATTSHEQFLESIWE